MQNPKLKVRDIHTDGIAEEFYRLMLLDIDDMLQHRENFSDTCCPACHGNKVPHAFDYQKLGYRRCDDCGMLYISPAPSEQQHLDFVRNSRAMAFWREQLPPDLKASRRPMYQERVTYARAVWQRFGREPDSVLELGAGNGEFAEELSATGEARNIVLLEPQALQLAGPNIEIISEGFEALERAERKFDTVFAWELIEHVLEPDDFLRLVRKVLKPGAPLILSTPNERSLETRKLGTASSNILFDHVRLYNPLAMHALMARNGFRIVELCTPGKLDIDRLLQHRNKHPEAFANDPGLNLILDDEKIAEDFQSFLQAHCLSSHMRVVAVAEGEWNGSQTPRI